MGELKRASKPRNEIVGSGTGLERFSSPTAHAEPIDYIHRAFRMEESWELVPAETRAWVQAVAGEGILDPFSGDPPVPRVYWICDVRPSSGGPSGTPVTAEYRLMLFGRSGLAVARGTCERFSSAGPNRWRSSRWWVRIDATSVRHDHRRGAVGNTQTEDKGSGGAGKTSHSSLFPEAASAIGNLPIETQRFLLGPFVSTNPPAQVPSHVEATAEEQGGRCTETYWCYLFNGRAVSFAHAQRSVPYLSGLSGPALWNGSPEAFALRTAPWDIAAWTAATIVPSKAVARA